MKKFICILIQKKKKAYVKLPQSFGFSKFVFKEQNLKIENDIIEKIGPD